MEDRNLPDDQRKHDRMQTFAQWISLPENRAAHLAVEGVADCVCGRGPRRAVNPLFIHGAAGIGKSHLVSALLADVTQRSPDLQVALLAAGDIEAMLVPDGSDEEWKAARQADLLVVEDIQHLPARVEETFVHLLDRGLGRGQQIVCSASAGPGQLSHLPVRLTSRLGSGLVVGMQLLSPNSRRVYLQDRLERRGLKVEADALAWLAEHLSGSVRQLEGALARLVSLARLHPQPLRLDAVAELFEVEASANRPTVERIAQRVGRYFHVEPRQLQGRGRTRQALLPRQIGMYLARQLTELSLQQIGAYFGGRDHSTVLHACRKVEQALVHDVRLSGAVRQLHADLT
jgi:chromosomal replication initiator protein